MNQEKNDNSEANEIRPSSLLFLCLMAGARHFVPNGNVETGSARHDLIDTPGDHKEVAPRA